jgi:hypothetical protein
MSISPDLPGLIYCAHLEQLGRVPAMNRRRAILTFTILSLAGAGLAGVAGWATGWPRFQSKLQRGFRPRDRSVEPSGYDAVLSIIRPWKPNAPLSDIARHWDGAAYRGLELVDARLADPKAPAQDEIPLVLMKVGFLASEGNAKAAYQVLGHLRAKLESSPKSRHDWLATVVFLQGVTALRRGENENCLMCRGESSCIFPIAETAIHTNPHGSRLAIQHFREYLEAFPADLGVRWLLNLGHMTLGEYPEQVDPRFRLELGHFLNSEFDIGKFRDVSLLVGLDRVNQAGGAIMDDFDNDGLLDIVVTATDPTAPMAYYRNKGDGTFQDETGHAGLADQLGGLVCYQADYDNDGWLDIFVPRAAWFDWPIRPSLLRNNRAGGFTDVTEQAGLLDPVNSNAAAWGDYDNDGWIDLFVACENQRNHLYRNRGNGTFEEVAVKAGVQGDPVRYCKGCTWIDYDNDGAPDLFLNNMSETGRLYHNDRDGRFTEVTISMDIDGPETGFSCWAWDYNNDGWLDIFAASADRRLAEIIKGLIGQPHTLHTGRLFRNAGGERFENHTREAGLDMVFAPMGSNFADFDNDGWLDFYLGTGEASFATLVPNRMFKNVGGERFAEITASSRTGHLQKGHAVACGDWDRDGDVDLFVETGGAVNGDKYHNLLFQNPGQGNHWLTLKLVGKKTNRAAVGARIKVVTAGEQPLTIHRHVSSGSSFGANPLEQTIGLAKAERIALLEVRWPTSGTTQFFHDVAVDQAIEVTEFSETLRPLDWKPIPQPD